MLPGDQFQDINNIKWTFKTMMNILIDSRNTNITLTISVTTSFQAYLNFL